MIAPRLMIGLIVALVASVPASAQVSQSFIQNDIATKLPSASSLTAATLRGVLNDMTTAIFQAQGANGLVVSGTPLAGYVPIGNGSSATWGPVDAAISGTPLVGYVPIGTGSSAVWGNALTPATLQFPNNINYSGAYTIAQQWLTVNGNTLTGTISGAGEVAPILISIGQDIVNTTTSGPGNLSVLEVSHATSGGTGGRTVVLAEENIVGTPTTVTSSGYVALTGITKVSANMGGTGGSYGGYIGATFGGNFNAFSTPGGTFISYLNAQENDVSLATGTSAAEKHGLTIVLGSGDVVRAAYDDAAIEMASRDNASAVGWLMGLKFGAYAHQWSFAADSTLIGAQVRQIGAASPSIALNGVDWTPVTFQPGGCAFKSTGFCIDPSGNLTAAEVTINPTVSTLNQGLLINQTPAGTSALAQSYNNIIVTNDVAAITGGGFGVALNVNDVLNGSTAQGGREAIQGYMQLAAPTNAANINRNYVGVVGIGTATAGDGGTNTGAGALGAIFGMSAWGDAQSGATNLLNVAGMEIDFSVRTGASTKIKEGLCICEHPLDAVAGATTDTALAISAGSGAIGLVNGILFTDANGQQAVKSAGTLIATTGGTFAGGIDLSASTLTSAFKSTGFNVGGSGNVTEATATLTAAAPTVAASQVGYGSTVTANTSCGTLAGSAGCLTINVAGTTRHVPYY
jgi:hypothetical protein